MTPSKLIEKYLRELKREYTTAHKNHHPSDMLRLEGDIRVFEKLQREIEREEKA